MNELLKRTLTGVVIVAAVVGAALAGEAFVLALLVLVWVSCCLEVVRLSSSVQGKIWGFLYVTAGISCVGLLYRCIGIYGFLGFFVLIWSSDIFAYVTGSLLGKHKLCPKISPSKTWEGAVGGFLFAMALAYVWKIWFLPCVGNMKWLVFSVSAVIAGMAGDLLESTVKRKAGVKDSGAFLPGHGGMLDRFDSVLLAAPVSLFVWFILNLF